MRLSASMHGRCFRISSNRASAFRLSRPSNVSDDVYTTNKQNGKKGTAKTVVFEKAVNGTYYVVEAVPDTAAKTTYIVSAYMSKKGAKKAAPLSVTGKESPRATPKHATRVAADDNISQIDADVNFADLRKITDAL